VFDVMELHRSKELSSRKLCLSIHYLMLFIGSWLLVLSNSATSLVSAIAGGIALWSSRYLAKLQSPGRIAATCLAVLLTATVIDSTFGVSSAIIHALGRKEDLTGRTDVWDMVMEQPINPIIGYGFSTFWDGPVGRAYNESTEQSFQNSQNGYLDVYVDGGIVGLLLLAWLLGVGGKRILEFLPRGAFFSRAKLTLFTVALIHDYSETSFFRLDSLWFVLLWAIITCPSSAPAYANFEPESPDHESSQTGPPHQPLSVA
jgi:exopolysaccharide production protein ExoQ